MNMKNILTVNVEVWVLTKGSHTFSCHICTALYNHCIVCEKCKTHILNRLCRNVALIRFKYCVYCNFNTHSPRTGSSPTSSSNSSVNPISSLGALQSLAAGAGASLNMGSLAGTDPKLFWLYAADCSAWLLVTIYYLPHIESTSFTASKFQLCV